MNDFPEIKTIKDILESYVYKKNKKFSQEEITKLMKIKSSNDELLTTNNRDFLIEILGLTETMSFDEFYKYLKDYSKKYNENELIFNSPVFDNARNMNYKDLMSDILSEKSGFNKCGKCGSDDTSTKLIQTRKADEAATEFNTCKNCGHKWIT